MSRAARPWLIGLLAWVAVIFTLSSFPNPPGPRVTEPRAVLAHISFYAVLGYLAVRWLAAWRGSAGMGIAAAAWLLAVAYGISDEVHQAFVPNRHASAFDVLADAAGAALGVALGARHAARRVPRISRTAAPPGPAPNHPAR